MPQDGDIGTGPDGSLYRYDARLGRGVKVTAAQAAKGGGGPLTRFAAPQGPGMALANAVVNRPEYQAARIKGQAKRDEDRQGEIATGLKNAFDNERDVRSLEDVTRQAPSGAFADQREWVGKNLGDVLGGLPVVPTREEGIALENLRGEGAQSTLANVKKLPGPLSEKELGFLQQLTVNAANTPERNQLVAKGARWANNRRAAYYGGMQAWQNQLGSADATNAKGETYDQWFGKWAAEKMPIPSLTVPSKRARANSEIKARSATQYDPAVGRILSVEN